MNIYKPICYGCPGPLMGDCADCDVLRGDDYCDDCEMDADDFADFEFEDDEEGGDDGER